MNIFLLDTHCILWFQGNDSKLSNRVKEIIKNPGNTILFSQISLYEIAIKQKIGKLHDFKSDISEIYEQAIKDDFTFLPLQNSHLFCYKEIPLMIEHKDPFDRLLIPTGA